MMSGHSREVDGLLPVGAFDEESVLGRSSLVPADVISKDDIPDSSLLSAYDFSEFDSAPHTPIQSLRLRHRAQGGGLRSMAMRRAAQRSGNNTDNGSHHAPKLSLRSIQAAYAVGPAAGYESLSTNGDFRDLIKDMKEEVEAVGTMVSLSASGSDTPSGGSAIYRLGSSRPALRADTFTPVPDPFVPDEDEAPRPALVRAQSSPSSPSHLVPAASVQRSAPPGQSFNMQPARGVYPSPTALSAVASPAAASALQVMLGHGRLERAQTTVRGTVKRKKKSLFQRVAPRMASIGRRLKSFVKNPFRKEPDVSQQQSMSQVDVRPKMGRSVTLPISLSSARLRTMKTFMADEEEEDDDDFLEDSVRQPQRSATQSGAANAIRRSIGVPLSSPGPGMSRPISTRTSARPKRKKSKAKRKGKTKGKGTKPKKKRNSKKAKNSPKRTPSKRKLSGSSPKRTALEKHGVMLKQSDNSARGAVVRSPHTSRESRTPARRTPVRASPPKSSAKTSTSRSSSRADTPSYSSTGRSRVPASARGVSAASRKSPNKRKPHQGPAVVVTGAGSAAAKARAAAAARARARSLGLGTTHGTKDQTQHAVAKYALGPGAALKARTAAAARVRAARTRSSSMGGKDGRPVVKRAYSAHVTSRSPKPMSPSSRSTTSSRRRPSAGGGKRPTKAITTRPGLGSRVRSSPISIDMLRQSPRNRSASAVAVSSTSRPDISISTFRDAVPALNVSDVLAPLSAHSATSNGSGSRSGNNSRKSSLVAVLAQALADSRSGTPSVSASSSATGTPRQSPLASSSVPRVRRRVRPDPLKVFPSGVVPVSLSHSFGSDEDFDSDLQSTSETSGPHVVPPGRATTSYELHATIDGRPYDLEQLVNSGRPAPPWVLSSLPLSNLFARTSMCVDELEELFEQRKDDPDLTLAMAPRERQLHEKLDALDAQIREECTSVLAGLNSLGRWLVQGCRLPSEAVNIVVSYRFGSNSMDMYTHLTFITGYVEDWDFERAPRPQLTDGS